MRKFLLPFVLLSPSLLFAEGGPGAYDGGGSSDSAATIVASLDDVEEGSHAILYFFFNRFNSITNVEDDGDATCTKAGATIDDQANRDLNIWVCYNLSAGDHVFTATKASTQTTNFWMAVEARGVGDLICTAGQYQASPTTSTDAVTSGTCNVSEQPATLFGLTIEAQWDSAGAPAVGSGFTNIGTGELSEGPQWRMEYRRVTTTGNMAATFTASNNNMHLTSLLAFEELPEPPVGPPAPGEGRQQITVAGLPWPEGAYSVFDGADPAVEDGDVWEGDTHTTPDNYPITQYADGTFLIEVGGDPSKQCFDNDVWDTSEEGWMGSATTCVNNHAPTQIGSPETDNLIVQEGAAIVPIDWNSLFTDEDGDAITFTLSPESEDTLPSSLTFVDGVMEGEIDSADSYSLIVRATDSSNDWTDSAPFTFTVYALVEVEDCTTTPTLGTDCALALAEQNLNPAFSYRCDDVVSNGYVISQMPEASEEVPVFTTVYLSISRGSCSIGAPDGPGVDGTGIDGQVDGVGVGY